MEKNKINKIGILIHDSREIDYYKNIIKHLNNEQYIFIIANLGGEDRLVRKMSKDLKFTNESYTYMSTIKERNLYLNVLVSVKLREKKKLNTLINKLVMYPYRNTIGALLEKTKFAVYLRRKIGVGLTFGGKVKWREISYISDHRKYFKSIIYFSRGLDIDYEFPSEYILKRYDYYFTHGNSDTKILKKYTNKPIYKMGYPRYDSGFNGKDKSVLKDIYKEFDETKKSILWMPSIIKWGHYNRNIEYWEDQISLLKDEYNIMIHPHPTRTVDIKRLKSRLSSKGIMVEWRNVLCIEGLYRSVDLVFCDYGGSIFSAIYCGCKIILLNDRDHTKVFGSKRKNDFGNKIRETLPYLERNDTKIKFDGKNYNDIKSILTNSGLERKINEQVTECRRVYFGNDIGNGDAHRCAQKFLQIIKNER